jgi:peptide/nickel transport system substrate-binding protein
VITRRQALQGSGVVALAGLLAACGAGGGSLASKPQGSVDINPQPRDKVRDGGILRVPIDQLPSNLNPGHVDGWCGALNTIDQAVLPYLFTATADGGLAIDPDYLTNAAITSTNPQVVTYTINPKARWSDGSPITYRDFAANWQALNGTNPAYPIAGTTGYDDIVSVARGVDDQQVLVTFRRPYGEWKNLFFPLTPASLNSSPEAFSKAWQTTIPVTSGPFTVQQIDQTAKTVTVARDPKWWGAPPKLDRIVFTVIDSAAMPDALANNELDIYSISSVDRLRRAQTTPGAVIRNAPSRTSYNITFNGAPGATLADLQLRQAIAQGINREEVTRRIMGQITPNARPNGNHLYAPGTKDYRDNADALPYDPAKVQRTLDTLGWRRQGTGPNAPRAKDGKQLTLRLVYSEDPTNQNIVSTIQNQLGLLGVTVTLVQADNSQFFPTYINRGNFDLGMFLWESVPGPFSSALGIYARPLGDNVRQNYGRIGTPEIDALFAQGTAELDDAKRAVLGNRVDRLIWHQAHSVILFTASGADAVRTNVANYGAHGFADPDYINAGFTK